MSEVTSAREAVDEARRRPPGCRRGSRHEGLLAGRRRGRWARAQRATPLGQTRLPLFGQIEARGNVTLGGPGLSRCSRVTNRDHQ